MGGGGGYKRQMVSLSFQQQLETPSGPGRRSTRDLPIMGVYRYV